LLLFAVAAVHGQDDKSANGLDADALKARITELEAVETPDDDQKAELSELKSAVAFLDKAATSEANTLKLADRAKTATDALAQVQADLKKAKADLESPPLLELPPAPGGAPVDELKAALAPVEASLESAKAQQQAAQQVLEQAKKDAADAAARRAAIPKEIADATSRRQEVDQLIGAIQTDADQTPLQRAQAANLRAEKRALTARLPELDQDLQTLEATKTLRQTRIDLAQARADQAAGVTSAVQKELDRRKSGIANRRTAEAERARRDAMFEHAVVRAILDRNATLAAEDKVVVSRQKTRNAERETVEALLQDWDDSLKRIQQQIRRVGLNDVIGHRLHNLRVQLSELGVYKQTARKVWSDIKQSDTRAIELEGEMFERPAAEAERLLDASTEPVQAGERDDILAAATAALKTQHEYLLTLEANYRAEVEALIKLHEKLTLLIALDDKYSDYIQQRILWIQSTEPIGPDFLPQLGVSLAWIVDGKQWAEAGRTVVRHVRERPVRSLMWFLPFAVLVSLRRPLRRRLEEFASKVKRASTDRFIYTTRATVVTVLLALGIPALLWALARLLSGADATADFVQGCAAGLDRSGFMLLSLTLLWHLCRPDGLGEAHFRWRREHLHLVRRNVAGLAAFITPTTFLLTLTNREAFQTYYDALGRLAFCVSLLVLAFFIWRVMHPKRGVLETILAEHRGGWLDRLAPIWFWGLVALPLAVAVTACSGFFLTAHEMTRRVLWSGWIVVWAVVVFSILLRWLYVTQRRLAVEQLKRRFEAEREAASQAVQEAGETAPSEAPSQLPDDVELDVETVSAQTYRLLKIGLTVLVLVALYFVWAEALPALSMLNNIAVWVPHGAAITVAEDGTTILPAEVITLADIGLAAIVLFATLTISRNFPGLLEILVLQRLPMTPGGRYTVRTLVRYAILIVGIVLTFDAIGIGWSKVQWLAAAVSVGLGFGLQEIFANFVSGLIILTERPIRVGDTVTVAGVSGTVTRIQMRATTVTDWDRKELIIPNKAFVTGEIVNWTLSSATLRLALDIGIAYGSDTETAKRLLLEVAHAEERVLGEPPPRAFFIGFGDNSLNFQLRIYIDDVDDFSAIRDKVLMAIDKSFRKANIEISFPQRDIHIRSIEGTLPIARDGEAPADVPARSEDVSAAHPTG
jgi:potassium efflux system protein